MKISDRRKLFMCDIGSPVGNYNTFSSSLSSVFVIAETFEEAHQKAMAYLEQQGPKTSITSDGSLAGADVTVKTVKIIAESFIY